MLLLITYYLLLLKLSDLLHISYLKWLSNNYHFSDTQSLVQIGPGILREM